MSHPLNSSMGIAWDTSDARIRRALCLLGSIDSDYATRAWCELSAQHRERLVTALRLGIDLGAMCSRVVLSAV